MRPTCMLSVSIRKEVKIVSLQDQIRAKKISVGPGNDVMHVNKIFNCRREVLKHYGCFLIRSTEPWIAEPQ